MRTSFLMLGFAAFAVLPLPVQAEPAAEAASAFGACLAAVIDGAPVADIKGQDVQIRRGKSPNSCTVEVLNGDTAPVRDALGKVLSERRERFMPARTRWSPGAMATRDTYCNAASVHRNLNAVISAALPAAQGPRVVATVLEVPARDERCDTDKGLQSPPA